jgi:hypothetical protein
MNPVATLGMATNVSGIPLEKIVDELDTNGYVVIPNFISPQQVLALREVLNNTHQLNSTELSSVYWFDAVFFPNAAGFSKTAFDILISPAVRLIAKSYLGNDIRLKCHRVYSTWRYFKFPWHTDNKVEGDKVPVRGLAFIIYLVDTDNGATQFAVGSHKVSDQYKSNNFTNSFVQKGWGDKIATASAKAGDLVLSDVRTIHRGSFWVGRPGERKSFWFQIDADMEKAERLLVNPAFMPRHPSQELLDFLGFGKDGGDLRVHPVDVSALTFFPLRVVARILCQSIAALVYHPLKVLRLRLPDELKAKLRRLAGRPEDWD